MPGFRVCSAGSYENRIMRIRPDDKFLQYSGRIDFTNPLRPQFVFPCSSIRLVFCGTSISITLENHKNYWNNFLGFIIDGVQGKVRIPDEGISTLTLSDNLEYGEHNVLIFKRQDSCHVFDLYWIDIDSEILKMPPNKPVRKIEVYGDSVSAGEVSEAVDYVGQSDPEHDGSPSNSYYSYAWMTARKLNAQIHDIAQGGIALLSGTGWFNDPDYVGMEEVYDKIKYNPYFGQSSDWDFSLYTPDVVIVALAQNDNHPFDYMKEEPEGEKAQIWKEHYKAFLKKLRSIYPEAWIICITTVLQHDRSWDNAIDYCSQEMWDDKVRHFLFTGNGARTPGHVRIPEAEDMACELADYIERTCYAGSN